MTIKHVHRQEDEPFDDLTNVCNEMVKVLEAKTGEDVKGIILLDAEKRGGLVLHGYDDETEALASILRHAEAIAQSVGLNLQVHTVGEG